jgi:hypothetical protein
MLFFFFAIWSANFAGIIHYFDIKMLHYRSTSHWNVKRYSLGSCVVDP